MRAKSSLIIGAAVVLGCLLLALLAGQSTPAQPPAVPPRADGRYQLVVAKDDNNTKLCVLDSQTGQCWTKNIYGDEQWKDHGSPVKK